MANDIANIGIRVDSTDVERARDRLHGFRQSGEQAQRASRRFGDKARSAFARVKDSVVSLQGAIGALAGAFAGAQLAGAVNRTLGQFEEIQRQADALGASTDKIQELQFAFREVGLQQRDVTDALATISDRADDATSGMQSFVDDFERFNVEVDNLRGKRPGEIFDLVVQRISEMDSEQRQVTAAVRLFGDEVGQRLLPIIREGAAGLEEAAQRARELDAVVGEDLVKASAEAKQEVRLLREQISAEFARTVAENADEIRNLADSMSSIAENTIKATDALIDFGKQLQFGPTNTNQFNVETLKGVNKEIERLQSNLQGRGNQTPQQRRSIEESLRQLRARQQLLMREAMMEMSGNMPELPPFRTSGFGLAGEGGGGGGDGGGAQTQLDTLNAIERKLKELKDNDQFLALMTPGSNPRRAGGPGDARGPTILERIDAQVERMDELNRVTEKQDRLQQQVQSSAKELGFEFESAFESAIIKGEQLSGVLKGLAEDIQRVLLRQFVTQPLTQGVQSGVGSFIEGLFSPGAQGRAAGGSPQLFGRAGGGPVQSGRSYIVGERGPELFTPHSAGNVTSSQNMGPQVVIEDRRGADAPKVEQQRERGANGRDQLRLVLRSEVNDLISKGEADRSLRGRFGVAPITSR